MVGAAAVRRCADSPRAAVFQLQLSIKPYSFEQKPYMTAVCIQARVVVEHGGSAGPPSQASPNRSRWRSRAASDLDGPHMRTAVEVVGKYQIKYQVLVIFLIAAVTGLRYSARHQ